MPSVTVRLNDKEMAKEFIRSLRWRGYERVSIARPLGRKQFCAYMEGGRAVVEFWENKKFLDALGPRSPEGLKIKHFVVG